MKKYQDFYIIGVDHCFGNMKTANCCFPSGVISSDTEPPFTNDLLEWNDKYYSIGAGHKEYSPDKATDDDYYVLTLAAIARELRREHITDAKVFIAAGLPLTWFDKHRERFIQYLLQHQTVDFTFRRVDYHIKIVGANVSPQGFAAVAEHLDNFQGNTMLCDIGNGTMNLLRIKNTVPDQTTMATEEYGAYQCVKTVRKALMDEHQAKIDEDTITEIVKKGTADIDNAYLQTAVGAAKRYTAGIFRVLREHDYDPKLMKLYVVGGGGCLIRHFSEYDRNRVCINADICAAAKGFEYIAYKQLVRKGGV